VDHEELIDVDEALGQMDEHAETAGAVPGESKPVTPTPTPTPTPLCLCNMPAKMELVKSQSANFGRRFWTCSFPISSSERCDFFQWATAESSSAGATGATSSPDNSPDNSPEILFSAGTFMDGPGKKAFRPLGSVPESVLALNPISPSKMERAGRDLKPDERAADAEGRAAPLVWF
jgi:hypothetical protein